MLRVSSFEINEYVICPGTTITIGDFDADGDCCINGDFSFFVRSRSVIKCGDDGKVENNCVITGGNTQIFYVGSVFDDAIAQNVKFQGITFQDASFVSAAMANRGDITFEDCIWQVR